MTNQREGPAEPPNHPVMAGGYGAVLMSTNGVHKVMAFIAVWVAAP